MQLLVSTRFHVVFRLGIRRTLLERGLVSWLVKDYLPRKELRIYGLEYSTALLMNLCLHKSGKIQCVPIANNVLDILVRLLVQDLKQVNQRQDVRNPSPSLFRSIPMSMVHCTACWGTKTSMM